MCEKPWKQVYASLTEAEEAYWRTPATKMLSRHRAFLLPYWCEDHSGFHLGHFDHLGPRALKGWGIQTYNAVNKGQRLARKRVARGNAYGR